MIGTRTTLTPNINFPVNPYPFITKRQIDIASQIQKPTQSINKFHTFNPGTAKAFDILPVLPQVSSTPNIKTSIVKSGIPNVIQTQPFQVVPTIIAPPDNIFGQSIHSIPNLNTYEPMIEQNTLLQNSFVPVRPQQQFMLPSQIDPFLIAPMNYSQSNQLPAQDPMMKLRDSVISKLDPQIQPNLNEALPFPLSQGLINLEPNLTLNKSPIQFTNSYIRQGATVSGTGISNVNPLYQNNPNMQIQNINLINQSINVEPPQQFMNHRQFIENRYSAVSNRTSLGSLNPIKDQFNNSRKISDPSKAPFPPEIIQLTTPHPSQNYAKIVSQVPVIPPQILDIIRQYKQKQSTSNIQNLQYQRGTPLGPYYIPSKHAYYLGQWINGLPYGFAKIIYDSNDYFQGFFINGQAFCNEGLWIYPDGSFYVGAIFKSSPHGRGQMIYRNYELVYNGQWENGKPHGRGVEKFKDGTIYEGQFKNGMKDGFGKFTWTDGSFYEGEFKNGLMEGSGVKTDPNGNRFQGNFHRNMIFGFGIHTSRFGEYKGEFKQNKRHGKGTFKYSSGDVFTGQFANDHPHGIGKLVSISGKMIQGEWVEGKNILIYKISQL